VLHLPEQGLFLGELSEQESARISQRRLLVERAREFFEEILISEGSP